MAVVTMPAARIGVLSVAVLFLAAGSVWAATINGTARNDTLRGGPRADQISGKAGNDKLFGVGGNDVLVGGPGNDRLVGGPGVDKLRCGPGRDSVLRDIRDSVSGDCEVVHGPEPASPSPPAPPPPPVPPASPGAPASYLFGPEVTPTEQQSLRDAFDLGARFIRSGLGRELPPFTVWAHTDNEALIRVYGETARATPETSRIIWTRGTFVAVQPRKMWVGPLWFSERFNRSNQTKIAVADLAHVLHLEIGGGDAFEGTEQIWRAGPRWLEAGHAELVGYIAVTSARITTMADVRTGLLGQVRASPVTLQQTAIASDFLRAQPASYPIATIAVDRLIAIGRVCQDALLLRGNRTRRSMAVGVRGRVWQERRDVLRRIRGVPQRPLTSRRSS